MYSAHEGGGNMKIYGTTRAASCSFKRGDPSTGGSVGVGVGGLRMDPSCDVPTPGGDNLGPLGVLKIYPDSR